MRNREFAIVALMTLGFGLVGIDRFLIVTMFPVIARELSLGYTAIGTITGALAFAWGLSALVMGNLSDRIGRRRVLTWSLVLFSLLIGASGLAAGLMSLVMVRIMMGLADGAYTPASISATIEASAPQRHGLNIGIQQAALPLFGLGFCPLIVTGLLHWIDWRWIFSLFIVPGLILAWAVWRVVPDPAPGTAKEPRSSFADWGAVLGYRNILVAMVLMLCWLTVLTTCGALLPSYLTDHLQLEFTQMGGVMSAIGAGAAVGTLALPWFSDRVGRRPVMILCAAGAGLSLLMLGRTGAVTTSLFLWLFAVNFFNNAAITLTVGPICAETVPPKLMATATGVVVAIGELFGGGISPVIGGQVAERLGIGHILYLPIGAMALALPLTLMLKETRPRVR